MPDVRITVNGQGYAIGCGEGEEDRVRELATYFNAHVERLAGELGHIAEARLLIIAGLTVCEELFSARTEAASTDIAKEQSLARAIDSAAERVDKVAKALGGTVNGQNGKSS